MKNRFVVSDWHFGHTNCWAKFKNADGSPLRPFSSTEAMNETLVEKHNAKVKPNDTVYMLGDVVINRKFLSYVKRLNGKLRLVRGNHDIFNDKDYYEAGFEQIHGVRVFTDKFILSHIPLHPDCVTDRFRSCIHGHLHSNRVRLPDGSIDPKYYCVSVEHTNYEPLSFEEVEQRLQDQWKELNYTPPTGSGWGNN